MGSIFFNPRLPSLACSTSERPANPKKVWNGSGSSCGWGATPPAAQRRVVVIELPNLPNECMFCWFAWGICFCSSSVSLSNCTVPSRFHHVAGTCDVDLPRRSPQKYPRNVSSSCHFLPPSALMQCSTNSSRASRSNMLTISLPANSSAAAKVHQV